MNLPGPVTFFAGENGSGKSTLLEALAIVARLPTVGATEAVRDDSLAAARRFGRALTAVWRGRTHRGFFLRAEDFFGFVQRLQRERAEMEARIEQVERDYVGRSELAKRLAMGPAAASLGAMEANYGQGPRRELPLVRASCASSGRASCRTDCISSTSRRRRCHPRASWASSR